MCLSLVCLGTINSPGATITVSTTADSGPGSLRAALASATDGDTIDATGISGTILLTGGELLVTNSVDIIGPGPASLAVDGNAASRVLHIGPGKAVTISNLAITNGFGATEFPFDVHSGGGIFNDNAMLTVSTCTLSHNFAELGGAIFNSGVFGDATLTVINTTLSGNSAIILGGHVWNYGFAGRVRVLVVNSTLTGNSADGGGGILNWADEEAIASLQIGNSTLSGNFDNAPGIFNIAYAGPATVHIGSTILHGGASGLTIGNLDGTITSLGYNLSSDDGGGFLTATGDHIDTDPMLGPLQDNGGPTFTHALLPGSAAIDAADPDFTPPPEFDQRGPGFPRVVCGRIDIGSFEVQEDGSPPSITCPDSIVTNAASSVGTAVSFEATATDNCSQTSVDCSPASGSTFPIGTTTVTCTATDGSANTNTCSFTIEVIRSDSDGDGVFDDLDMCPDTAPGAVVDADGCSIDQLVLCSGPASGGAWRNHGHYVLSVVRVARQFLKAGLITREQSHAIVSQAARSNCGKRSNEFRDVITLTPPGSPKESAGVSPGNPGNKPLRP